MMSPSTREPNHSVYLPALTSLRFFAAAMIVIHHYKEFFVIPQVLTQVLFVQGVSFFFILSGFVLTYVYGDSEEKIKPFSFWIARFARIWPLHVATLLLSMLLFHKHITNPWVFLANLGMVHAWIPLKHYFFSYNSLSWAISAELALYLCFPFLIRSWRKTWYIKTIGAALLLATAIALCNLLGLPHLPETGIGFAAIVYISPIGRLFEFCLGMAAVLLFRKIRVRFQPSILVGTLLELFMFSLTTLMVINTRRLGSLLQPWIGNIGNYWIQLGGASTVFFAGLIVLTALNWGAFSRILSNRVLVFLGEISFAIYLLHQMLLRYYTGFLAGSLNLSSGLFFLLFWIFLIPASSFAWAFLEKPSRRLIKRGFRMSQEKWLPSAVRRLDGH